MYNEMTVPFHNPAHRLSIIISTCVYARVCVRVLIVPDDEKSLTLMSLSGALSFVLLYSDSFAGVGGNLLQAGRICLAYLPAHIEEDVTEYLSYCNAVDDDARR